MKEEYEGIEKQYTLIIYDEVERLDFDTEEEAESEAEYQYRVQGCRTKIVQNF